MCMEGCVSYILFLKKHIDIRLDLRVYVCARASIPWGCLLFPAPFYERRGSERAADVKALTFMVAGTRARVQRESKSPPLPPPPKATARCSPTYIQRLTQILFSLSGSSDRLTMEMIQAGKNLICVSPQDLVVSKAALYPSRSCENLQRCVVWWCGGRGSQGQYTEVTGKAPKQMCHRQTSLGDLFSCIQ